MNLRLTASRLVVGVLGLVTSVGVAGAHTGDGVYTDGHMWDGGMGGWGGGWMILWGLLWLVLLVVAVAAAVRWLGSEAGGDGDDAVEVLRERYARGEIDHEEFERRRSELKR